MFAKVIAVLLSLSLLLSGCSSGSSVTKGGPKPAEEYVYFYMKDGSFLEASPKEVGRIAGGYRVIGTLQREERKAEHFEGVIQDSEILRIGSNKEVDNSISPATIVIGCGAVLLIGLLIHAGSSMGDMRFGW